MTIQDAGAHTSPDSRYCYRQWRRWDESLPRIGFILLGPTMAAQCDMLARCITRAVALDFGAVEVAYLFPLRTLDPSHLGVSPEPVGDVDKANAAILDLFDRTSTVVAAWGNDPVAEDRADELKRFLRWAGYANQLYHFGNHKDGNPKDLVQIRGRGQPKRWAI